MAAFTRAAIRPINHLFIQEASYMYASNHLLVFSQSDFIQRQLCTAITDATAARAPGRSWLRLFHR